MDLQYIIQQYPVIVAANDIIRFKALLTKKTHIINSSYMRGLPLSI